MKKLPKFSSSEEFDNFFENQDLGEYDLKFEPANFIDNRKIKKEKITMSIDPTLKQTISLLARRKGIAYQTLIQMWLKERTNQEIKCLQQI